jgi:DNA-binding PadR family transcriptional regulator
VSDKTTSPPRDKRSKRDLELFVLALLECNVNTPYELLAAAGLSPGATLPALRRLEESGYVQKGKPGSRGRVEYHATPDGQQHVKNTWRSLLDDPAGSDMDSILRTATLAQVRGAPSRVITKYLKRAADLRAAESDRHSSRDTRTKRSVVEAINVYSWMQRLYLITRLSTESRVLKKVAGDLPKRFRRGPVRS